MAVGGNLSTERLLDAYQHGIFPMHLGERRPLLCWWAPDPRGVMVVDEVPISRSLRRARKPYQLRIDTAFASVVDGCAQPDRPHGWINHEIRDAYVRLHELGYAHSVEAWIEGELAGGLYGVALGGLFAGESMFHRRRDASKAALVGLLDVLAAAGPGRLIDVQWLTPHLSSLGAVEMAAADYAGLLAGALALPGVDWERSAALIE